MEIMRPILLSCLLATACHVRAQTGVQSGPSMEYDPQIVSALLDLLNVKDNTKPASSDFTETALKDIIELGTPSGYQLRTRYTHLGASLSEGLAVAQDPRLKAQMIEQARWERNPEIRAVALIAVAARKEPKYFKYYQEALINIDPGIRFAALEGLENWGPPEAKAEFERVARQDLSPVVRIYAAQALLRRGDPKGREFLLKELDSGDWIARAMAARYLGELGQGRDYTLMLDRMSREQTNDFVIAEMAIAGLKLFPKYQPVPGAPPPRAPAPGAAANEYELEPLVVTAPRLKIPATALIDGRININLMRLLENKAEARPTVEQLDDPSIKALNALSSPRGFQLKTRYTELGFLLTEGLAGTSDLLLRERILKVARSGTNPQVRAAAMMAIAYDKKPQDRGVFQEALLSQDITVRWGAVEALYAWGQPEALGDIGSVARMDLSPALQVYAASLQLRMGDPAGRDILIRHWIHFDWLVRALAIRYLGEFGTADDFPRLLMNLPQERNNFVRAEFCAALLRLYAAGKGGKTK